MRVQWHRSDLLGLFTSPPLAQTNDVVGVVVDVRLCIRGTQILARCDRDHMAVRCFKAVISGSIIPSAVEQPEMAVCLRDRLAGQDG